MATLDLTYTDLKSAVGDFLGFGFDYSTYSATNISKVERIIASALRKFYYWHGMVDGIAFDGWSFLTPTGTVSLVASTSTYDLASNFADLKGKFTYAAGLSMPEIEVIDEQNIRAMYAANNLSGYPQYAAVKSKTTTGTAAQGYEVIFYPNPSAATTLTYRYQINPLTLTDAATYPLGGPQHAETIREACLAEAELSLDDTVGVHTQRYADLLMTSARLDMRAVTPETLGRNIDRSDYTVPFIWG